MQESDKTTRKPAVAGMFYPANELQIKKELEKMLSRTVPTIDFGDSNLVAIVVPHAGWVYSGPTAALAFNCIKDINFSDVFFLGVDHRTGNPGVSVWAGGNYLTPLGEIETDKKLAEEILNSCQVAVDDPSQHTAEHSLEVLAPFFQTIFPDQKAVFITVGGKPENAKPLSQSLHKIIAERKGKTLLIVSTDWSHFHNAETAKKLDDCGISKVMQLDAEGLYEAVFAGKTELCGFNAVLTALYLMVAAKGETVLLEQTDSSAVSNDTSSVVGYASIVIHGQKPGTKT